MRLSVVIPARNEAAALPALLADLAPLRAAGGEVIVVDGGSVDGTPDRARTGAGAEAALRAAVAAGRRWGRFDVRLSGRRPIFRVIAALMNRRSCLTGIATGDQGIFVTRSVFEAVGGWSALPLMEDVELSRRLRRRVGWPACLRPALTTASRRWEEGGVVRTILLMWGLRLAFFLGVPARVLARWYR